MTMHRLHLGLVIFLGTAALVIPTYVVSKIKKSPIPQIAGKSDYITPNITIPDTAREKPPTYSQPLRLLIPQIKVDAGIVNMGLTEEGEMEVPEKITDLGWYKNGPHPGEKGSAVIAGHIGVGKPGVFRNLDKLKIGDTFMVIDSDNQIISFTVREMKTYDSNEHPEEVFFSSDGNHLNLVTCAGDWNKWTQNMTERLVVFADKV
jgi:LPXTG-site transpeptidase (sortase) family protein